MAVSLSASATEYKIECCNGTFQTINSVSFQAICTTGYLTWEQFYNILKEEGEKLCSDHCVRNIYENKTSIGIVHIITRLLKETQVPLMAETNAFKETEVACLSVKPTLK